MNDNYVLCVEHFQINASEPRSNYDSGDEYRAFLNKHRGLVEQGSYGKLEILLDEEGIAFSTRNLVDSLLHSLKSKIPKIPLYKQAAREYIETGTSIASVQEDLAKRMEVWFLIEDVTPTTSADSLFSSEDVLGVMDECDGLEGLSMPTSRLPPSCRDLRTKSSSSTMTKMRAPSSGSWYRVT